jgi:hypothetical protein
VRSSQRARSSSTLDLNAAERQTKCASRETGCSLARAEKKPSHNRERATNVDGRAIEQTSATSGRRARAPLLGRARFPAQEVLRGALRLTETQNDKTADVARAENGSRAVERHACAATRLASRQHAGWGLQRLSHESISRYSAPAVSCAEVLSAAPMMEGVAGADRDARWERFQARSDRAFVPACIGARRHALHSQL